MTYVKKACTILVPISFLLILTVPAFSHELPMVEPEAVGLSTDRLSRIDTVMEKHIAEKKIAGAVTLVARHGKIAYIGAHGMMDVEAEKTDEARYAFPDRIDDETDHMRRCDDAI